MLRIRQGASSTGDFITMQNSSGTNLARIQSNGIINAFELRTNNTAFAVGESNSGANIYMIRQTAVPGNPGANAAFLYFRAGTNAGTLRLAVRAGASGAETTILDNIPT